jgi:ribonuclease Z
MMKPLFQPKLVNDIFGDPVLYVDFLFERRALLFDLGDIRSLSTRKLLRVTDVFVSHTHMDHFADFDWLLRLTLGRDKRIRLYGPEGFIDKVQHKLCAYTWNLVENYKSNLTLEVMELHEGQCASRAKFYCHKGFSREDEGLLRLTDNVLIEDAAIRVRAAVLDHNISCIGYMLEEKMHVNVWKNRLQDMGLPVGAWLKGLKQAVLTEQPDETPIRVWGQNIGKQRETSLSLGALKRNVLRIVPGQKIGYITDIVYHPKNAQRVIDLVRGADQLFIEATFLHEDAEMAAMKYHLTAYQARILAQRAGVKRVIPCHLSPRYNDRKRDVLNELHLTGRH